MRFSVIAALFFPVTPAFSQSRIELTGKPDAVIAEPFTSSDSSPIRFSCWTSARMTASGGGDSRRAPPAGDPEFPVNMPAFIGTSVVIAPYGAVLVGRSHRFTHRTWSYDLFDRTGRHAGSATIQSNSVVVGFGNGAVYVARTDPDDDLVYLERHRVR